MENTQIPIPPEQERDIRDRIAVLGLKGEQKTQVAESIITKAEPDTLYRIELIASVAIATFGLLIDSAPVVIGAMLIAPVLKPIQSIAFSLSTGNRKLYISGVKLLAISIFIGLIVSGVLNRFTPFSELTNEIIARTKPTFIDLLIAVAGGAIAMLAIGYQKLSESLAGVAMATALIPPLAVAGIGISTGDRTMAQGASILLLTNIVAIVITGIIVFYLFGFFPTTEKNQQYSFRRIGFIALTVIIVAVPLINSMQSIAKDFTTQRDATQTLTQLTTSLDPRATLSEVETSYQNWLTIIQASLRVPQSVVMTQSQKLARSQALSTTLDSSIDLELILIPTTSVILDPVKEITPTPTIPVQEPTLTQLDILEQRIYQDFALLFPIGEIYQLSTINNDIWLIIKLSFSTARNNIDIDTILKARKNELQKTRDTPITLQTTITQVVQQTY